MAAALNADDPMARTMAASLMSTGEPNPSAGIETITLDGSGLHHPLLAYMSQVWKSKEHSDFTLKARGRSIKVHKVFIAPNMSYFQENDSELSQNCALVDLDPDILELVLKYLYTGWLEVTRDTIHELLKAADHLGVGTLQKQCRYALLRGTELTPDTCLELWGAANDVGDETMCDLALNMSLEHFDTIQQQPKFPQLSIISILKLLSNDKLNVQSPEERLGAAVHWMTFDPETRVEHLPSLLEQLPLEDMHAWYLRQVMLSPLVKTSPDACNQLKAAVDQAKETPRTPRIQTGPVRSAWLERQESKDKRVTHPPPKQHPPLRNPQNQDSNQAGTRQASPPQTPQSRPAFSQDRAPNILPGPVKADSDTKDQPMILAPPLQPRPQSTPVIILEKVPSNQTGPSERVDKENDSPLMVAPTATHQAQTRPKRIIKIHPSSAQTNVNQGRSSQSPPTQPKYPAEQKASRPSKQTLPSSKVSKDENKKGHVSKAPQQPLLKGFWDMLGYTCPTGVETNPPPPPPAPTPEPKKLNPRLGQASIQISTPRKYSSLVSIGIRQKVKENWQPPSPTVWSVDLQEEMKVKDIGKLSVKTIPPFARMCNSDYGDHYIGGLGYSMTEVWKFNIHSKRQKKVGELKRGRQFHAMCFKNGRLFILGGRDESKFDLKFVEILNPLDGTIAEGGELKHGGALACYTTSKDDWIYMYGVHAKSTSVLEGYYHSIQIYSATSRLTLYAVKLPLGGISTPLSLLAADKNTLLLLKTDDIVVCTLTDIIQGKADKMRMSSKYMLPNWNCAATLSPCGNYVLLLGGEPKANQPQHFVYRARLQDIVSNTGTGWEKVPREWPLKNCYMNAHATYLYPGESTV